MEADDLEADAKEDGDVDGASNLLDLDRVDQIKKLVRRSEVESRRICGVLRGEDLPAWAVNAGIDELEMVSAPMAYERADLLGLRSDRWPDEDEDEEEEEGQDRWGNVVEGEHADADADADANGDGDETKQKSQAAPSD